MRRSFQLLGLAPERLRGFSDEIIRELLEQNFRVLVKFFHPDRLAGTRGREGKSERYKALTGAIESFRSMNGNLEKLVDSLCSQKLKVSENERIAIVRDDMEMAISNLEGAIFDSLVEIASGRRRRLTVNGRARKKLRLTVKAFGKYFRVGIDDGEFVSIQRLGVRQIDPKLELLPASCESAFVEFDERRCRFTCLVEVGEEDSSLVEGVEPFGTAVLKPRTERPVESPDLVETASFYFLRGIDAEGARIGNTDLLQHVSRIQACVEDGAVLLGRFADSGVLQPMGSLSLGFK